eukprot:TRINITY_DN6831_c0_g2_i1.p1 TRINITY_DN6831_c0_g2~~TRINITY_DN6831_c0_g2_i1.p1  ORF type:complete len:189 (+),score=30.88 TRINITY_DN6831_c0_g2_i1:37-603(+)
MCIRDREYVASHKTSILAVHKYQKSAKFNAFCDNVQQNSKDRLHLLALLIQPVQRIPRYQLLLADLHKNTPENHPDYVNLGRAVVEITRITTSVNEQMDKHENFLKLTKIQKSFVGNIKTIVTPHRSFVREGALTKICRKVPKKRWFWLFSDSIAYGSIVGEKFATDQRTTVHIREASTKRFFTLFID